MSSVMQGKHKGKKNVLLVNITRLGDMLQATPTIAGIKMENPDAKISVLVEKQFAGICDWLPDIDEVLTVDLGTTVRALARGSEGLIEAFEVVDDLVKLLRSKNFDYCLNMSSSAYTALLLKLVGVKEHGGWMSDDQGHRVIESEWAKLFATSVFHQNRQFNSINLVDVFRCSANVTEHPDKLQVIVDPGAQERVRNLLAEARFTNTGPIIALQAGASQGKRQWLPKNFIALISLLLEQQNARLVLTGTDKELHIIEPIKAAFAENPNVFVAAGKTKIAELAALLDEADLLITGDTGPMHIAAATSTPVLAMFLASAYGFETGPYGADHIVLQPVIACGPCNPNKPCARPDCHDQLAPELMAALAKWRLDGMTAPLPASDPQKVIIYRSTFDKYGFCDLLPLNDPSSDWRTRYRNAYRRMWLDDLAGLTEPVASPKSSMLNVQSPIEGLETVIAMAKQGEQTIDQLVKYVMDPYCVTSDLKRTNEQLSDLDRNIEQIGFHFGHLGPVTRMFIFAKENIVGTDAISLASQMKEHYRTLERRCIKLYQYYNA